MKLFRLTCTYGDGPIIYMAFAENAEDAFRYMSERNKREGDDPITHWSAKDLEVIPMRKGCFMRELP